MNDLKSVVRTTVDHIGELSVTMASEVRLEAERLGHDAKRLLFRSYKGSSYCRTGLVGPVVAGIWGVYGNSLGHVGCPWFVIREDVNKIVCPIYFARFYREELKVMREMFPTLENWVDSTYNDSVRLLRVVGFNLDEPTPHGKNGALFRRFWLET